MSMYKGQFGQDFFVSMLTNPRRKTGIEFTKFFVDVGCGTSDLDLNIHHVSSMSNTWILEKHLGWEGIALDYDQEYCKLASPHRKSVHCVDLLSNNINDVLEERGCPDHFDYFSFDVDMAQRKVLDELDFDKYSFKIMTYEHNFSTEGDPRFRGFYDGDKDYSREKFTDLGYKILFGNVGIREDEKIEDWYVNDELFEEFRHLAQDNITLQDIVKKIVGECRV